MKKTFVAICLQILLLVEIKAQVAANWQVATWYQFKPAAVSYTLDDDCTNQLPIAVPMFDKYNFKVTLFTVITWNPNWPKLLAASNNGHEVASHTNTHPTLNTIPVASQNTELGQSQATINTQIPNKKCVTVAYPNCVEGDLPTIQKYYIAGRTCNNQVELATPNDFYDVGSIITGTQGPVKVAADFNTRVASALASKGWCVFLTHGIDNDGGYSPTVSTEIQTHLAYMATNTANFWIGTFGNVIKYIKERNSSALTETTITSDSLQLTVTNSLDVTIYNVPITVRRSLSSGWKGANVYINNQLTSSTLSTISGTTYVTFDVVPNQGNIYLSNLNKAVLIPAPTVNNSIVYCQNVIANALTATGTALKWYTSSVGGLGSSAAPIPATNVAGTTNYYVSQTLGGVESIRALISVVVNALPNLPFVLSPISICQGASAPQLTASGTALKWYTTTIGGAASLTAPFPTTSLVGTSYYYVSQTINNCESPKSIISVAINLTSNATVSIATSATSVCSGTGVTFTATGINAGSSPTFTWYKNNAAQGISANYSYSPSNGDVVKAVLTAGGNLPNCLSANQATSNGINLTVNPIQNISMTIAASATTICSGTGITFTATGINAGSSPNYTWYKNNIAQGNGITFSYSPSNGDAVQAILTTGGNLPNCLSATQATSNGINLTVNPIQNISVTIAASATTVCSGTGITFTATGINAGSSPTFTWYKNNIAQGNGITFSYSPSNGDVVKSILTVGGNLPNCLSTTQATSNGINLTVNPIQNISVTIASSATTACLGTGVTFTATGINAGSLPTFIWYKNNVAQGNGITFSYSPTNGDVVNAILIAGGNLPNCLSQSQATSNGINLTINANLLASVSITVPTTTLCSGINTTLTAIGINAGTSPSYTWFKNNIAFPDGATFTYTPSNGDEVYAILTVGGTLPVCLSNATASSNSIPFTVAPCLLPQPGSISGPAFVTTGSSSIVYSVQNIPGNSYLWTVPSGATITSGQGTGAITVDFGSSPLTVTIGLLETNANGSTQVTLSVSSGIPPTSQSIVGPTIVQSYQSNVSYAIASSTGVNYFWTVPLGVTLVQGQGLNNIAVDFGSSVSGFVVLNSTNNFGAISDSIFVATSVTTSLINNALLSEIILYPNPSSGTFNIRLGANTVNVTITVTDNKGINLFTTQSLSGLGGNLPYGHYIVSVLTENGIRHLPFVKLE